MNRKLSIALLVACAVAFVLGIGELFKLRFESGDVYPPYSTLRTDPLGASAFYEGLQQMPGITASRDLSANEELPDTPNTAYLHLAGDSDEWEDMPKTTFQEADGFVRRGGRLVIAFYPEPVRSAFRFGARTNSLGTNSFRFRQGRLVPPSTNSDNGEEPTVSLTEKWGVDFEVRNLKESATGSYEPVEVLNANISSLPPSLDWHTGQIFTNVSPAWRVIYARGADPVMIERQFGRGSVVLSTDSYFVSNEAMEKDRHADLLAWLVGSNQRVIFDEAHLGIVEKPGVATLVRKYQLHGFMLALLFLAGLFIWKNSTPLAPAFIDRDTSDFVTGKDSAAGFVNLLRRNVPYREVLHVCLTEWRKSRLDAKFSAARMARAQGVIDEENSRPPREHDPVRTYHAICQALNERPAPGRPGAAPGTRAPTTSQSPGCLRSKTKTMNTERLRKSSRRRGMKPARSSSASTMSSKRRSSPFSPASTRSSKACRAWPRRCWCARSRTCWAAISRASSSRPTSCPRTSPARTSSTCSATNSRSSKARSSPPFCWRMKSTARRPKRNRPCCKPCRNGW